VSASYQGNHSPAQCLMPGDTMPTPKRASMGPPQETESLLSFLKFSGNVSWKPRWIWFS